MVFSGWNQNHRAMLTCWCRSVDTTQGDGNSINAMLITRRHSQSTPTMAGPTSSWAICASGFRATTMPFLISNTQLSCFLASLVRIGALPMFMTNKDTGHEQRNSIDARSKQIQVIAHQNRSSKRGLLNVDHNTRYRGIVSSERKGAGAERAGAIQSFVNGLRTLF